MVGQMPITEDIPMKAVDKEFIIKVKSIMGQGKMAFLCD